MWRCRLLFFLLNSAFAMEIMDIISRVHVASVVMLPESCNIPHSSVDFYVSFICIRNGYLVHSLH